MAYQLGIKPDTLKVLLHRDGDFDSVLTRTDDDGTTPLAWAAQVRLVFLEDGREWHATVAGADARFQIDRDEVNTRLNKGYVELWVGEQCWAQGRIVKTGLKGVPTGAAVMPTDDTGVIMPPDPDPDPDPDPTPVASTLPAALPFVLTTPPVQELPT